VPSDANCLDWKVWPDELVGVEVVDETSAALADQLPQIGDIILNALLESLGWDDVDYLRTEHVLAVCPVNVLWRGSGYVCEVEVDQLVVSEHPYQ
jgi:hypothetical protein